MTGARATSSIKSVAAGRSQWRGWRAFRAPVSSSGNRTNPNRAPQRCLSEHQEQRRLFLWLELMAAEFPERREDFDDIYAIPNGGFRHLATAGRLRAEGVKKAVPDVHCAVPVGIYHGLFIEMKSLTGTARPEQRARIARLRQRGYRAEVTRGWIVAARLIAEYLGLRWNPAWIAPVEVAAAQPSRSRNSHKPNCG